MIILRGLIVCFLLFTLPCSAKTLLEFEGKIYPRRFLQVKGIGYGHHAIVWKDGRTSEKALLEAEIPDREVADILAKQGLVGGNNLTNETWTARNDPNNPAADARVAGPTVEVTVTWEGLNRWKKLKEILGMPEADYRFGDHRSLIPIWKSGCIVCDVSCPGGKISNHSLTIRDQVMKRLRPKMDLEKLPKDGTRVRVRISK
ncbi:MAG: hypothetical protein H6751_02625 [Candidatus Omnitrophica bacterium]|nr:hypothetical protein [Candidatus Omnitrophota bacterium]